MSESAEEFTPELADEGSYVRFDCGCEIWTQDSGDRFVMRPCSLTCEKYQYAMRQSKRAGNQIRFRAE